MTNKMKDRVLALTRKHYDLAKGSNRHFTFIFDKTKLIGMGYNNYYQDHPYLQQMGYGEKRIHSELSAVMPFRNDLSQLNGTTFINTRMNRYGKLGMSKPCSLCWNWLHVLSLRNVIYTDPQGNFQYMI